MSETPDANEQLLSAAEDALTAYFGDEASVEDAGPAPDTSLSVPDDGPARDAQGRFASTKDEALFEPQVATEGTEQTDSVEPVQEEATDSTEEAVPTDDGTEEIPESEFVLEVDDPELMQLLEDKYGGDVLEALKGLKEAQNFIGKQSDEIGELRQLRQEFEQLQQQMQMGQYAASIDWEEAIDNDPEQAALQAFELGDMQAFGQAIDAVGMESPFKASVMMQAFAQLSSGAQQEAYGGTTLETEVEALKSRLPDLQQTLPAIQQEVANRPALQQALESGDPRVMTDALETAYTLAKSRTSASDTSTARTKLILKAKAQADAAIADAAVVGASTVPQVTPPKNPNEGLENLLEDIFGEHVPVV